MGSRSPRALALVCVLSGLGVGGSELGVTVSRAGAAGAALGALSTPRAVALGRGATLRPLVASAASVPADDEIRLALGGGVTEWWRPLSTGLEHGLTLAERPAGTGTLVVDIEIAGLSPHGISDDEIELRDRSGRAVASYAHLVVLDASGTRVPAVLHARDELVRIEIDDDAARYPLVVDPLFFATEEATLSASDITTQDQLGLAVAISSDGTRAVLGSYFDDTAAGTNAGSARVFVRSGSTWAEEAALFASGAALGDNFGYSVAISGDGTRVLVGALGDDTAAGASAGSARVFVRSGTTWTEEATLLAAGLVAGDNLGHAVALSGDGLTALVGAPQDDTVGGTSAGSARVFSRSSGTWVEIATLLASGAAAGDTLGISVALSADGSRALVGAPADATAAGAGAGSARVYSRAASWAEEATLTDPGGAADDLFGTSVALSSDGSRALVGALQNDTIGGIANAGSAHVFLRSGTTWAAEASLVAAAAGATDLLGNSVALSADGSRALVGARADDSATLADVGSVRLFARTGTSWSEEATLYAGSAGTDDRAGSSVSLTGDGTRALVGVPRDDTGAGTDAGTARAFLVEPGRAEGAACATDAVCASDFCTDGVCCDLDCGNGASDCQACTTALTGVPNGTCAPLTAALAPTITCRASGGACDADERCSSASTSCPTDVLAASGTECRAAAMGCDGVERCDGTSPTCPADVVSPPGFVCRASTGPCDIAETCNGVSGTCPGDMVQPNGTACGTVGIPGSCSGAGLCDGATAACPSATVRPAGTVCLPAVPGSICDRDDVCDGVSSACIARFADATTACGSIVTGVCDAPDHCSGTSADCVFEFISATECRPSAGACDPPEVCSGTAASCPPDLAAPSGTVCRASTDLTCDPLESCDGISALCPTDVESCTPLPDAGTVPEDAGSPDAGAPTDGGAGTDAAPTPIDAPAVAADAGAPVAAASCACRTGAETTAPPALLAPVLAVALAASRRRRPTATISAARARAASASRRARRRSR